RQYETEHHADRDRAMPAILQYTGALVSMLTIDPDEPCGVRYSLIDPMCFFPIMEGARGLSDAFLIYEDSAANIVGNYGGDDEVERAVEDILATKHSRADRLEPLEVISYWNRDFTALFVNDKHVFTREHGMGKVPFVLTLGSFEIPQGVSTGSRSYFDKFTAEPGWHHAQLSAKDIAAQWRPWAYGEFQTHLIQEAVAGRTLTEFKRSMFRPMVYEFDPLTRNQD